jgi:hypothetical protein
VVGVGSHLCLPSLMLPPSTQDTEHTQDLESTLLRLEEEQQR